MGGFEGAKSDSGDSGLNWRTRIWLVVCECACQWLERNVLPNSQPGNKKILHGFNDFRTYIVLGSLKDPTIFLCTSLMIFLPSRVLSRLFYNNNNTTVSSTSLVLYIRKSYRAVIITYQTTTLSHNLNPLCTEQLESIISSYKPNHTIVLSLVRYFQN